MSKRPETIHLEELLHKDTRNGRFYGCEEVTIGFMNNGHGNEIVDYMTMDSKGTLKCYELKVTMEDLKSKAKKSWYGHYNYLVTIDDIWKKIKDNLEDYIPAGVGVIVGGKTCLSSVKKATKKKITSEQETMLKESLVRSMYWKMIKYKDAIDPVKVKELNQRVRRAEKEKQMYLDRALESERIISDYETYKYLNTGKDIELKQLAKKEKEKWREADKQKRIEAMKERQVQAL